MDTVLIEDNVKMPANAAAMKRSRDKERKRRLFKAYANAYEACHIMRPTNFTILESGSIAWDCGSAKSLSASERRLKELTKMLRDRARDR